MEILRLGSMGPMVEYLQSILKMLGFYTGLIDGIFGAETQNAVRFFQRDFSLTPDGIFGQNSYRALSPYLNGYTNYTIKSGDRISSIASRFGTTSNRIVFANPNLNPNRLMIGQVIKVPFGSIVPTDISYSSTILARNLTSLSNLYPFLQTGTIGTSVLGKPLSYVRIGTGSKEIFYNASFHANEWITSVLLMKFIENYAKAYAGNSTIFGYNARELFSSVSLYLVPMVNPDGVDLVTKEIKPGSSSYEAAKAISDDYPTIPFPNRMESQYKRN